LTASDVARDDQFATSVSLSADGNTALIGALYRTVNQQQSAGAAYVFVRPSGGTTWTQQQELTASDASQGNNFGSSVALSDDGNTALIGALYRTVNQQQSAGAAYVFVRPQEEPPGLSSRN
jgi:PDZ domain-containing secreted protein